MAFLQSPWGSGRIPTARPQTAHATHSQLFIVDVPATAGFASGDVLELGILPAYATILDATIVPVGSLGASTIDVGIMTGEIGELTNTDGSPRTVGNEIFDDAAITALLRLTKTASLVLPTSDKHRSIGVLFNGAVAAGAGKRLGVLVHFAQ